MTLHTHTRSPASGGVPKSMVMLLHGLGANGADLINLADYWNALLPDTVFVSPDAPFPCDMAPYGFQWFSLQNWSPAAILDGVETAAPILNNYIDQMLARYNLQDQNLALAGFSQGTMMSLYAGLRRRGKIAGILGYSGALIGAETLAEPDVHKTPIHLIHGDADAIVLPGLYHASKSALIDAGFTVTGGMTPGLAHGIDADGIASGGKFLYSVLNPAL